jgi:hypothetical protein
MQKTKVQYIKDYLSKLDLENPVDQRVSELVRVFYLSQEQKDRLTEIDKQTSAISRLAKVLLPLLIPIKHKELTLEDLQGFGISKELYVAIAEMSYYPHHLDQLDVMTIIKVINELVKIEEKAK